MPSALIPLLLLGAADEAYLPPADLDLVLAAPITTWDEAIPLGNGLLGGLLWGEGSTLRLSLDRGDLWDLRPAEVTQTEGWTWSTLQRLVAEGDQAEINRLYDAPYGSVPHPTKIPAGRVEIDLGERHLETFRLHLATAEASVLMSTGHALRCFYSADQPVALMYIPGAPLGEVRIEPPASVDALDYPPADLGSGPSSRWYTQEGALDLTYVGMVAWRDTPEGTLVAATVAASRGGRDVLDEAWQTVHAALSQGYEAMAEPHRQWWRSFWSESWVRVPDHDILRHYYLVHYFYGAASRPGAPPMPLQGVWTADAGGLPPWKGDYHHDLNTQMTYHAYLTAGHWEEGRVFLEFMWELLPEFRRFASDFYGTSGAAVPGVMALDGTPLGGWSQYSLSPTNAAWIGWMYYQHWLYTADDVFLRTRAYPWCSEIGRSLLDLLEPDAEGTLRLPLSSSPEVHDNSLDAWLEPNSNYDSACMEALFLALSAMARAMGEADQAASWRVAADGLGSPVIEPGTGCLMFAQGEPVRESHRHLSHSMAIHPFGLIHVEAGEDQRRIIEATNARYDELGTQAWVGYSFSWMSCLRARAGEPEAALDNLEIFVRAFVLRNGFHVNGDQTRSGYSGFTYRPFTLEGNFLAAQAVHEMLLQSWSTDPSDPSSSVIRIFPSMPESWADASFADLRAEGGHRVSARREEGRTTWVRVAAGSDGRVRIRDCFGGAGEWSVPMTRDGDDLVVELAMGESVEGWST